MVRILGLLVATTTVAVHAHLPIVLDAYRHTEHGRHTDEPTYRLETSWEHQSVALYVDALPPVDDGRALNVVFDVTHVDEPLTLSISMPPHVPGPSFVNVTLLNAVLTSSCEPHWTGWSRRLDVGDATTTIPPVVDDTFVFEPFGVGYYRPLRACKARFDAPTTDVRVRIHASTSVPVVIGLGVREQWSTFALNPALAPTLAAVFHWFGRSWTSIVTIPLLAGMGVVAFLGVPPSPWTDPYRWMTWGTSLSLVSPVAFAAHLAWVAETDHARADTSSHEDPDRLHGTYEPRSSMGTLVGSMALHVFMPVVAATWWWVRGRGSRGRPASTAVFVVRTLVDVIAVTVLVAFTWQSYWVGPVLVVVGSGLFLVHAAWPTSTNTIKTVAARYRPVPVPPPPPCRRGMKPSRGSTTTVP